MDPWASMMHNLGSMGRDSMQFPRWIQGTWLEFHRVINADRASMMQSPAGRDSMQFPRWIPRDLVGVPSSDQRRPGRKYADVGKHWLNVCRRRQTLGERRQTPGRDSMHNHGSMGRKYAQPWIPGDLVGVPSSDPWAGTRCSFLNRFHGGRDWLELRAGTRCSSLDGSQGTWLEFHRVINADRASMMQSPAGRDWLELRAGTRAHNLGSMGASMMQTSANRAG